MPLMPHRARLLAAKTAATLQAFVRDDDGQDLVEYAFLAAFVATAGYLVLQSIVPALGTTYTSWLNPTTGTPSLWEPAPPWTSSGS